jgi:hypothetical protein
VEDVKASEVLTGTMVLLEEHRVFVVLVDGFPLLLGDANGAAYGRCDYNYWSGSERRRAAYEGSGGGKNVPSVMLSHAAST